jgi:hypothetical protein
VATNTNGLVFTPNESFDGSVDNVYCKKILTGKLSGSYIVDSIGLQNISINDTVVSYNDTWSSGKIMEELNKLARQFGLSDDSQDQANSGLPLQIEYYSSTQIRIKCINEIPVTVVFPDLTTISIDAEGFTGTVTGSTSTTYYVYIDKDSAIDYPNGFHVTTDAPDSIYPSKQTLGDTYILVGYLAFSATDTLSGNWNVYSFWNEPDREWSSGTIDSESFTFTKSGLLIPPEGEAIVTRSGATTISSTVCGYYPMWASYCTVSASASSSIGTVNCVLPNATAYVYYSNVVPSGEYPDYVFNRGNAVPAATDSVSVAITPSTTLTPGVYNSITLTATRSEGSLATYVCADNYNETYVVISSNPYHVSDFTARTGNLTITRQGNI